MCSGSNNAADNSSKSEMKQIVRDHVKGASEQFIDDFVFIDKRMQNNSESRMFLIFISEKYAGIAALEMQMGKLMEIS